MKKRVTFTVDEDVYEGLNKMPRGVSVSEMVSWFLKALITDMQGMSDEEFKKLMESDPRGREVRKYLRKKIGPAFDKLEENVEGVKEGLGTKKEKELKIR